LLTFGKSTMLARVANPIPVKPDLQTCARLVALTAWEAYQANGLHLTLEEADAWMAKREAGQDVEPSPCHL